MYERTGPCLLTNVCGQEQFVSVSDLAVKKRRLMVTEVNSKVAEVITFLLMELSERSDDDIYMFINSPGGSVSDGMAIYDVMNAIPCDVVTIATGNAASMGAFLLAAGTPGKRFVAENAEIMIHQPLGGIQGQATDISLVANHIMQVKEDIALIMAEKCGKGIDEVLKDMERDYWMNAQQALDYGIVDHIGFPNWR